MPRPTIAAYCEPGGLRERKKAQTPPAHLGRRDATLPGARFDEVTVAEIAGAADVSVKTVFNYFGSKEDLLFDRRTRWWPRSTWSAESRRRVRRSSMRCGEPVRGGLPSAALGCVECADRRRRRGAPQLLPDGGGAPAPACPVLLIDQRVAAAVRRWWPRISAWTRTHRRPSRTASCCTPPTPRRALSSAARCWPDASAEEIRERSIAAGTTALRTVAAALPPLLRTHEPAA